MKFRSLYPVTGSWGSSYRWVFGAAISCDPLYEPVCLLSLEGIGLPCGFLSLTYPRQVRFSICSAFYSLGWSDNFETPYMQNHKAIIFIIKIGRQNISTLVYYINILILLDSFQKWSPEFNIIHRCSSISYQCYDLSNLLPSMGL